MDLKLDSSASLPSSPGDFLTGFYLSGFSFISHLLSTYINVDLSTYMPLIIAFGALTASLGWKPLKIRDALENWLMCSVEVKWTDNAFEALECWLSQDWVCRMSNHRVVTTRNRFPWIRNSDEAYKHEEHVSRTNSARIYNLPRLILPPATGRHWFVYQRHLVLLTREDERETWGQSELLRLKTFGWNNWVLRAIMHDARLMHAECDENKTVVYRGQFQKQSFHWIRAQNQPIRSLSTVVMDPALRDQFVQDVGNYLQPATRAWYARRGIPYRRGYLFTGPPGTGKTSLCIATAGVFKLKIYIMSLNNMTDDGLYELISTLPERCILLLEDIDAQSGTNSRTQPDDSPVISRPLTLSSVLNAIDGVVASQDRVLILTTNHKDKLDPALMRPGRVDMEIPFGYSGYENIKQLFLMMYSDDSTEVEKEENQFSPSQCEFCPEFERASPADIPADIIPKGRLEILADEFAASFHETKFTQADICGHLLKYRNKPELAVQTVDGFINGKKKDATDDNKALI